MELDGDWPPDYTPAIAASVAVIEVESYWATARIRKEIAIHTENIGAGCGVPWKPGECWLIEAWRAPNTSAWQSSTCSLTNKVSRKPELLERLLWTDGPGKAPDDKAEP